MFPPFAQYAKADCAVWSSIHQYTVLNPAIKSLLSNNKKSNHHTI
jgi:hypothetical protein